MRQILPNGTEVSGSSLTAAAITTTGNVVSGAHVGVGGSAPRAWSAGHALEKGNVNLFFGNGTDIHFNSNAYFDGAWKYSSAAAACGVILNAGDVAVRSAASGSAGAALTWLTRWTFQNAGNLVAAEGMNIAVGTTTGTKIGTSSTQKLGFFNATPVVKPTVTGSRGGNAALASLLTQLASLGLITDSTTA